MTEPRADAASSGDPPPPFCPRCARAVDMASIGPQVGLCHCLSCQRYACRWCWLKARGRCPMCAAPYEVWTAAGAGVGGMAAVARIGRRRRKLDRRAAAAIGMVAVLAVVVSWATASAFGLMGTAGADATSSPPGLAGGASGHPIGSSGAPGSVGPAASSSSVASGGPGPSVRPGQTPSPGTETAAPGSTPNPGATPTPLATPAVTPAPTPKPTPEPTPRPTPRPTPTPTPTPTPACLTVPNLIGMTVSAARGDWTGAGFSGAFSSKPTKNGNYLVISQSPGTGACVPAASEMVVTSQKP